MEKRKQKEMAEVDVVTSPGIPVESASLALPASSPVPPQAATQDVSPAHDQHMKPPDGQGQGGTVKSWVPTAGKINHERYIYILHACLYTSNLQPVLKITVLFVDIREYEICFPNEYYTFDQYVLQMV